MGVLVAADHEEDELCNDAKTTENNQLSSSIPETVQPVYVNADIDVPNVAGIPTNEQRNCKPFHDLFHVMVQFQTQ